MSEKYQEILSPQELYLESSIRDSDGEMHESITGIGQSSSNLVREAMQSLNLAYLLEDLDATVYSENLEEIYGECCGIVKKYRWLAQMPNELAWLFSMGAFGKISEQITPHSDAQGWFFKYCETGKMEFFAKSDPEDVIPRVITAEIELLRDQYAKVA